MASPAAPQEPPRRRVRRRRSRSFRRVFQLTLLACAVIVITFAVMRPRRAQEVKIANTPSPFTEGLALDQVRFDPPEGQRAIVGVVRNATAADKTNVVVRLALWTRRNGQSGTLEVAVPRVPARGEAAFRSEPVPEGVVKWSVAGLE